jgi:hypothetical protein
MPCKLYRKLKSYMSLLSLGCIDGMISIYTKNHIYIDILRNILNLVPSYTHISCGLGLRWIRIQVLKHQSHYHYSWLKKNFLDSRDLKSLKDTFLYWQYHVQWISNSLLWRVTITTNNRIQIQYIHYTAVIIQQILYIPNIVISKTRVIIEAQ